MTQDRYAVFGNPIEHSLSPRIHAAFASQTNQVLVYDKQRVESGEFVQAADSFFEAGGQGLNVTVPFKEDAFGYAAELTQRARRAGAVNTLIHRGQKGVLGDNTDGAGLVQDIQRLGWPLERERILVLGAGGAVRGVLQPLLDQQPERIVIANRTVSKAQALADAFASDGPVEALGFEQLEGTFGLVINGTSASLAGDLPPVPDSVFAPGAAAYDMMYGAQLTPFLRWAQDLGVERLADGLGMLVGQAAEAFFLWRGVRPEVDAVLHQLREELG